MTCQDQLLVKVNQILGKDMTHQTLRGTIEALVKELEQQQKEYIFLSQSNAEDDAIIQQLREEIERVKEHWIDENRGLFLELRQAHERIKDLEEQAERITLNNFEQGMKKAGYMDLDD